MRCHRAGSSSWAARACILLCMTVGVRGIGVFLSSFTTAGTGYTAFDAVTVSWNFVGGESIPSTVWINLMTQQGTPSCGYGGYTQAYVQGGSVAILQTQVATSASGTFTWNIANHAYESTTYYIQVSSFRAAAEACINGALTGSYGLSSGFTLASASTGTESFIWPPDASSGSPMATVNLGQRYVIEASGLRGPPFTPAHTYSYYLIVTASTTDFVNCYDTVTCWIAFPCSSGGAQRNGVYPWLHVGESIGSNFSAWMDWQLDTTTQACQGPIGATTGVGVGRYTDPSNPTTATQTGFVYWTDPDVTARVVIKIWDENASAFTCFDPEGDGCDSNDNTAYASASFNVSGTPSPTRSPTRVPTLSPTASPVAMPTFAPTIAPTSTPTFAPTRAPTATPTRAPTLAPTSTPTFAPTRAPTATPTRAPTLAPTATPSRAPTLEPTATPTRLPTLAPTATPTRAPTLEPTSTPTNGPTATPTHPPTFSPTTVPSNSPTHTPTFPPATSPTARPTQAPTFSPTSGPITGSSTSLSPTLTPTAAPVGVNSVAAVGSGGSSFPWWIIVLIVLLLLLSCCIVFSCVRRRRQTGASAASIDKRNFSVERDNPAYGVVPPSGASAMGGPRGVINNDLYQGVAIGGGGGKSAIANDAYIALSAQEPTYADAPVLASSRGPAVSNPVYSPRAGWPPGSEPTYSTVVPRAQRATPGTLVNSSYNTTDSDGSSAAPTLPSKTKSLTDDDSAPANVRRPPPIPAPQRRPVEVDDTDPTYCDEAAVVTLPPPKVQYSVPVVFGNSGTTSARSDSTSHSQSTGHYSATVPAYMSLDDGGASAAAGTNAPIYNEAASVEGEYMTSAATSDADPTSVRKVAPTPKPRPSLAQRRAGGIVPQALSLSSTASAPAPSVVSPGRHYDEPIAMSPKSPPGSATSLTSRHSLV